MTQAEDASRGVVKERAFRGVRWVSFARIAAEVLGFASSVVLAHLISPAQFGHAAVALTLYIFGAALAERGFGSALVQRKSVIRGDVEAAFFASVISGGLLTVAIVLLAPIVFEPLFGSETSRLLQIASLAFAIAGLAAVPRGLLLRRLDFRATSIFDIAGLTVGVGTSVGLALAGVDAQALVIGALAGLATTTLLALASTGVPLPRWHRGAGRRIVSLGVPAGLASLFNMAERNIDYAILGAKLGPAQVGFYWRAYKLGVDYQGKITAVMMQMAFPIYSRSESLEDMRALRVRIARLHATVVFPLLALFIPLAPVLIPWMFGSDWGPAVRPAQILAVGGMAAALASGNGSVVLAAGRSWSLVSFALAFLVLLGAVVFLTAPHGLIAVCIGVVAVRVLSLVAGYYLLLQRLIGVHVSRLWADAAPGAVSSLAILLAAFPLTRLMSAAQIFPALILVLVSFVGAAAYLVTLRALFPHAMADIALLARRFVERSGRRPPARRAAGVEAGLSP